LSNRGLRAAHAAVEATASHVQCTTRRAELIKVIHSTVSRKHFSGQTQAQIELGLEIAPMAEEEIAGGKTPMEALHNPNCGATVPLVKQTWLCKKESRYVALKMIAPKDKKQVRFEVVEARTATGLGFDVPCIRFHKSIAKNPLFLTVC
jgi:hypothetical protein